MSLYDFHPLTVTDAVRTEKSRQMDAFWNEVKEHKETDLPLLRSELAIPEAPAVLPYGRRRSSLLSLSSAPADQALAVKAMSGADLSDVTPSAYFYCRPPALHAGSRHNRRRAAYLR